MTSQSICDDQTDPATPRQNECEHAPRFGKLHLSRRWLKATLDARGRSDDRQWRWSRAGIANVANLEAMRNIHWGKRCFVLGNGPSLTDHDLAMIRDEYIIASNRIYLHPSCRQWSRWYYCAVNPHVIDQFRDEIGSLPAKCFLAWESRDKAPRKSRNLWLRTRNEPRFSFDLTDAMWQGATVTYVALQLAFHLGFTDVVLLGVDHHYSRTGQSNKLVVAGEPDPDHFSPSYFGEGVRWQLPDLAQSELAYRLARLAFEQEGRRIRNATRGGQLEVFPRVAIEGLL